MFIVRLFTSVRKKVGLHANPDCKRFLLIQDWEKFMILCGNFYFNATSNKKVLELHFSRGRLG